MNQPEHTPEDSDHRIKARLARREDAKTNPLTLSRQAQIEANRALWAKMGEKIKAAKRRKTPPAPPAPDAAG
jgi:hypothetical protein